MKVLILSTSFLVLISNAFAQTSKISGSITGINLKGIDGATICLRRSHDSATLELTVTDIAGKFVFENIGDGKYRVSATATGYKEYYSKIIQINSKQPSFELPVMNLVALTKSLVGVTVSTKKALVEQKIDRTIIHVDASITNIGGSALDVLEKTPGVSVDQKGNISLKGKEGVLVMVDGRPTQLDGADLANMLRHMSSNQLDQIEIMTNPPARFDAAGTSGIINIRTKKIITTGMNGTGTVGYSQGKYPKTNEGFYFNYREGKVNLFSSVSHNYQKVFSTMIIKRAIFNRDSNSVDKIFNQESDRISTGNSIDAKAGLDIFATKKTTFGAAINLNSRLMSSTNLNITNISNVLQMPESITNATVNNGTSWTTFSTNLNYRTVLNNKGSDLTSDIDIVKYSTDNNLFMVNSYTNSAGNPYSKADTLKGLLPQNINVYSARVDYMQSLKRNGSFEAGIKSGTVKTDNNAGYDSIQFGKIIHDFNRSNHFVYEENISAAYMTLSTPISKKINAQFGLRLENTSATGRQISTGESFNRNYTQLFPTGYFQYKANDRNNFGVTFGRRVLRPSYQSLNPFIKFLDKYTYTLGNPNLTPSVSNNFEISHVWKKQITTTLNYSNVKDIINEIIQQKGQEAYNMPANGSSFNQLGVSISANTPVNKWWMSSINVNVYKDRYRAVISSAPIDLVTTSFAFDATQQFKVTKTLTSELNGRYRTGWLEGAMRLKSTGFIGAGCNLQVLKNQGTLRLTLRDIFYTQKLRGKSKYGNVDFEMQQLGESRIASISFSYRINRGKKIVPVKRSSGGVSEERGRIAN